MHQSYLFKIEIGQAKIEGTRLIINHVKKTGLRYPIWKTLSKIKYKINLGFI